MNDPRTRGVPINLYCSLRKTWKKWFWDWTSRPFLHHSLFGVPCSVFKIFLKDATLLSPHALGQQIRRCISTRGNVDSNCTTIPSSNICILRGIDNPPRTQSLSGFNDSILGSANKKELLSKCAGLLVSYAQSHPHNTDNGVGCST